MARRAAATGTPILHVDMDAFYASVESRDDPKLRGLPLAVGGGGARGVVMSASYEARRFGVRSAMPSVRARRLCPDLVFVSPDFTRYRAESERIMEILCSFTPLVEQLSLDEAFCDVRGAVRLFGEPPRIAERIRERVRAERDLVCSVGVAPNKFLAKLASAQAKPDGICVVPAAGGVAAFLDPLPVERLWGVGSETATSMRRLGIRTIGELRTLPREVAERAFGASAGPHLLALARGSDDRAVVPHEPAKQVSAEQTFERDLDEARQVRRELLRLSDRVAGRLRASGVSARTITIKVRFSNFRTVTRSRTLGAPTAAATHLYRTARELYEGMRLTRPRIRLLGVAATGLVIGAGPEQLRLGERPDRWGAADAAVDRLRRRFGRDAVEMAAAADRRPRRGETSGPTRRGGAR